MNQYKSRENSPGSWNVNKLLQVNTRNMTSQQQVMIGQHWGYEKSTPELQQVNTWPVNTRVVTSQHQVISTQH